MSWIAVFIDDTNASERFLQTARSTAQAAATPMRVFSTERAADLWAFQAFNVGRTPLQYVVPTLPSLSTEQVVEAVGLLALPFATSALEF